jgi:hypothetical protein
MLSLYTRTGRAQSIQQLAHRATKNQGSIPGAARIFSFLHSVQTVFEDNPVFYPMGTDVLSSG